MSWNLARSGLPFATLDAVILGVIERAAGKPCPTTREIVDHTGMPRRKVWPYIAGMVERGLIEMEVIESRHLTECPQRPRPERRRLRVAGGKWTFWTRREQPDLPRDEGGRYATRSQMQG